MTREEQYLAKIAGEETDIPSKPILRSEQYLAKIAGEDVGIPQKPLHNEETYLAILAGEDYEIPAPYNRIEQYMAKACGAEIEVPTPITRVEQLWAQIAEGGSWTVTEITGTLPLMFLSKGDDLIDYHIYGTTEGAGVETENLIEGEIARCAPTDTGELISSQAWKMLYSPITENETYTIVSDNVVYGFYETQPEIGSTAYQDKRYAPRGTTKTFTAPIDGWIAIRIENSRNNVVMLVLGSTSPDHYIPHGYKLPLTVESGAQSQDIPIYIGDSKLYANDFLDFEMQKIITNIETTVFTGTELSWYYYGKVNGHNTFYYNYSSSETQEGFKYLYCNKYETTTLPSSSDTKNFTTRYQYISSVSAWNVNRIYIFDDRFDNINDFKDYLQSLYSSGDSLIVTRQTATSESKDPPVPLPPIPTYKDENTLSSTETLSEVTVKGRIKETENG